MTNPKRTTFPRCHVLCIPFPSIRAAQKYVPVFYTICDALQVLRMQKRGALPYVDQGFAYKYPNCVGNRTPALAVFPNKRQPCQ